MYALLQSGKTALDVAVAMQRWNIVEILVGVGAMNGSSLVEMVGVLTCK